MYQNAVGLHVFRKSFLFTQGTFCLYCRKEEKFSTNLCTITNSVQYSRLVVNEIPKNDVKMICNFEKVSKLAKHRQLCPQIYNLV